MELNWLGDNQRLFLSRDQGYLQEEVTPEQRYTEICDTIERICGENGHFSVKDYSTQGIGNRFRSYIEDCITSFASPVLANFGNNRGLPISCVGEDTWINTSCGGKKAKDISVGDKVLTHKGRFKSVTKIIPTKNRSDIYHLKVSNRMTVLELTGDHKVKTNLGWTRVDELDPKVHLVAINGDIEHVEKPYSLDMSQYVDFDYIIQDGLICKTRTTSKEVNAYYSKIRKDIPICEDLAWAIGLWFADGSIARNNKGVPNGIRLTSEVHEQNLMNTWMHIITDKFNLNGSIYESRVKRDQNISKRGESEWITCNINGTTLGRFFDSFGKNCKTKTIPQFILDLPKNILQKFLDGLFDGDGHLNKYNCVSLTLANPQLVLQAYLIGLKLGHPMSLQMQLKKSGFRTSNVYRINFRQYKLSTNRHLSSGSVKFSDGLYYSPIKLLEKTDKTINVFDFTVDEDHSFSCSGVVVHNCNHGAIPDTMEGIMGGVFDMCMMAKHGAGTAKNFSNIRPIGASISTGGKSSGVMPWIELYAKAINNTTQSSIRRGFLTAYLSVDHPEIMDFLDIGTDKYSPVPEEVLLQLEKAGVCTKSIDKLKSIMQGITTAVTLPKGFRQKLQDGDKDARKIWTKILKNRAEIGYPYILDEENCNKGLCKAYEDKGMWVNNSNICIECAEYTDHEKEFACCLSSINVAEKDKFEKYPYLYIDHFIMLDCVITEYIEKASKIKGFEKAVKFAKEHRAIGLGTMGLHTYLQSKMIPFGSIQSQVINDEIFKTMREEGEKATSMMAEHWGEPEILKGYVRRNTSLMAQAPTKSTAYIIGGGKISQGIQPIVSNYHEIKRAKIQDTFKNHHLEALLKEKGKNTKEVWRSILEQNGSVQHLSFLSKEEKDVFKCFREISQMDILKMAGDRQKYIDMGQSVNLAIHPDTPPKEINRLHLAAFNDFGLKSLYYQYSTNAAQEYNQSLMSCSSCEG